MSPTCRIVEEKRRVGFARRAARRAGARLLRRFVRRKDGAAAVEFGLVLLPFLSILFMIIETALVFFAQQTLETAAVDSGRLIMTGQAQSFDAAAFKTQVCSRIYALFDCSSGMHVDVRNYAPGTTISNTVSYDSAGKPITQFSQGSSGTTSNNIVVVRLIYAWPITTPLAQMYLSSSGSTTRQLVATTAFVNEPY